MSGGHTAGCGLVCKAHRLWRPHTRRPRRIASRVPRRRIFVSDSVCFLRSTFQRASSVHGPSDTSLIVLRGAVQSHCGPIRTRKVMQPPAATRCALMTLTRLLYPTFLMSSSCLSLSHLKLRDTTSMSLTYESTTSGVAAAHVEVASHRLC